MTAPRVCRCTPFLRRTFDGILKVHSFRRTFVTHRSGSLDVGPLIGYILRASARSHLLPPLFTFLERTVYELGRHDPDPPLGVWPKPSFYDLLSRIP